MSSSVVDVLTDRSHSTITDALRKAFPGMEIDLPNQVLDQRSGNLAIHMLSQAGSSSLLKQLLEVPGVDINARNTDLETALLLACRSGRFSTAMLLVERGADVSSQNVFQENALHWIHSFRFFPDEMRDLTKAILAKGPRTILSTVALDRPSRDLPEHPLIMGTPICRAIVKGCDQAGLLLWELEREAFAPQKPGYLAIEYAAKLHNDKLLNAFLEGRDDLVNPDTGVSLLTSALNSGTISDSSIGRILRHGAKCQQSGVNTLKILCKYGVSSHFASIPGMPGCNVLSLAVHYGSPETVEVLLNEMGCEEFINVDAVPPRIAAAVYGNEPTKYSLGNWKTPLIDAAMLFNRPAIFKLLLRHGADVNRTRGSETAHLLRCIRVWSLRKTKPTSRYKVPTASYYELGA